MAWEYGMEPLSQVTGTADGSHLSMAIDVGTADFNDVSIDGAPVASLLLGKWK